MEMVNIDIERTKALLRLNASESTLEEQAQNPAIPGPVRAALYYVLGELHTLKSIQAEG